MRYIQVKSLNYNVLCVSIAAKKTRENKSVILPHSLLSAFALDFVTFPSVFSSRPILPSILLEDDRQTFCSVRQ